MSLRAERRGSLVFPRTESVIQCKDISGRAHSESRSSVKQLRYIIYHVHVTAGRAQDHVLTLSHPTAVTFYYPRAPLPLFVEGAVVISYAVFLAALVV